MIDRAYDLLDRQIMKGVNAGVKAYNWTTGGTKSELANIFENGYGILCSSGFLAANSTLLKLLSPIPLLFAHTSKKKNVEIETLELKARENGLLDPEAEQHKKVCKGHGAFGITLGLTLLGFSNLMPRETYEQDVSFYSTLLMDFGIISGGLAYYVMRADSLPPQKNCISRGTDKLKQFIQEQKKQPVLNYSLEDRLY